MYLRSCQLTMMKIFWENVRQLLDFNCEKISYIQLTSYSICVSLEIITQFKKAAKIEAVVREQIHFVSEICFFLFLDETSE